MKTGLAASWQYVDDSCPEDIKALLSGSRSGLRPDSKYQVIWLTRNKYVLLLESVSGRKFVYKAPLRIKNFIKYCLRPGPYGREAVNYECIRNMGIPVADLLAAGETRKFFKLQSGFIVTAFAEGFSDGRDFMPGGCMRQEKELLREFTERNFRLLAVLHNNNCIHKGFTPANILYRKRLEADGAGNWLDIKWIDLASCRRVMPLQNKKVLQARDLSLFFYYLDCGREEKLRYLEIYCREMNSCRTTPEELLKRIEQNPVR